jgi:hypothetical protein
MDDDIFGFHAGGEQVSVNVYLFLGVEADIGVNAEDEMFLVLTALKKSFVSLKSSIVL